MSKELNHRITGLAQWGDVVVTASGCPAMLYLHERGRLLGRLRGHSGRADVLCAVGPTLLSVGSDGCGRTVRVWDLVRRAAVGALGPLGPAERVTCMCHPPTYLNKVVLGLADGSLQLWNFRTARRVHVFDPARWNAARAAVTCVVASPAVDVVAVGLADGRVVLHNLRADAALFAVTHAGSAVCAVAFRTDGAPLMATGSARGGLAVWDLERRELVGTVPDAHGRARVAALRFLDGEPVLVSTGADNSVRMWIFDAPGDPGAARLLRARSGHAAPPRCLAYYGADARTLLSAGGADRALRLFSVVRDQQCAELSQGKGLVRRARRAHTDVDRLKLAPVVALAAEPAAAHGARDWPTVVTAHAGSATAHLWSVESRALAPVALAPAPGANGAAAAAPLTAVAMSACGNFALTAAEDGAVARYNVQSGALRAHAPAPAAHTAAVVALATDATNSRVVSASLDGSLCFLDFDTLAVCERVVPAPLESEGNSGSGQWGLPVTHMAYHRDTGLVAAVTDDGCIRVYDAAHADHRLARRFDGHRDPVTAVLFTEDARWLLSAAVDGTVRVWDMAAGRLVDWFATKRAVTAMAVSPSGDFLATTHAGRRGISLWANRTYFSSVILRPPPPIPALLDIPARPGPALLAGTEADPRDTSTTDGTTEDAEAEAKAEAEAVPTPEDDCPAGMVTLTGLAAGKWQNIDSLEEIRERNKPTEVKAQPQMPFFLPIIQGLQPRFDTAAAAADKKDDDKQEEQQQQEQQQQQQQQQQEPQSRILGKRSGNADDVLESRLGAALARFEEDGDSDAVVALLLGLAPSAVDFEMRSLPPSADGRMLALMLDVFTQQLDEHHRANFDVVETHLRLFLKLHADTLIRLGDVLHEHIAALAAAQKQVWAGVEALVNTNLCMLNYTTGIRM